MQKSLNLTHNFLGRSFRKGLPRSNTSLSSLIYTKMGKFRVFFPFFTISNWKFIQWIKKSIKSHLIKLHPWFIASMNSKFVEYLESSVRNWKDQYFCYQINLWYEPTYSETTVDVFQENFFNYFQAFEITQLFTIKKKTKKNYDFAS